MLTFQSTYCHLNAKLTMAHNLKPDFLLRRELAAELEVRRGRPGGLKTDKVRRSEKTFLIDM